MLYVLKEYIFVSPSMNKMLSTYQKNYITYINIFFYIVLVQNFTVYTLTNEVLNTRDIQNIYLLLFKNELIPRILETI
jgi:hypothetical protein